MRVYVTLLVDFKYYNVVLRWEAFQNKKQQNFRPGLNRGWGRTSKNEKSPKFQLVKVHRHSFKKKS